MIQCLADAMGPKVSCCRKTKSHKELSVLTHILFPVFPRAFALNQHQIIGVHKFLAVTPESSCRFQVSRRNGKVVDSPSLAIGVEKDRSNCRKWNIVRLLNKDSPLMLVDSRVSIARLRRDEVFVVL